MLINHQKFIEKENNYIKFFEFSAFCSIPIFFILGSFFVNSVLVLMSLYCIFLGINKNYYLSKKDYFIITFAFIFLLINSYLSDFTSYTLQKSSSYFRFLLFFYFCLYFLITSKSSQKKFFSFLISIVVVFVIFDLIIQYFTGTDLFGYKVDHTIAYGRLGGPFGKEYIVGSYLFCFGLISYAFLRQFYNINYIYQVLYLSLISVAIFITGERNAFLCTLLFMITLFILNKKSRKTIFTVSLIVIFICSLILKNDKYLSDRYSFKTIPIIINDNKSQDGNNFDLEKTKKSFLINKKDIIINSHWFMHYRAGIKIFENNKIIGSGFRTFRFECHNLTDKKNILCSNHPHNIYIELISDTGLIGFLLFMILILSIVVNFFKKKLYKKEFTSILICILASFIFPLKPHGSLFSTTNAFMIWYILIFLLWSIFYQKQSEETKNEFK